MTILRIQSGSVLQAEERLNFQRDIQPILSNNCWSCHGADEASRKGGLRLDVRTAALTATDSGNLAIVPGKPDDSELVSRIASTDPNEVMPPPSSKKSLSMQQQQILRRWVEQGADYAQHWSFTPPLRSPVPEVKKKDWPRSALDQFILRKLEDEGLQPAQEVDKSVWLRRVTLDLTGLPPTPEDLGEFLEDSSPSACEKVVDRLLTSPAYAERMAMLWLDAARYADTNGYNNDEMRTMWPWRDWVIQAYADGMPYDQFLVEQLAGDLLPNATLEQRVATGFHRNHVLTTEGGIIEEEYHVEYVADRVHTASTVVMALSFQCARCHDHKYDPISQRDYYQFSAFFNNIPDKVVPYSKGRMAEPLLQVPSREQRAEMTRLSQLRSQLESRLRERSLSVDSEMLAWEKSLSPEDLAKFGPANLVSHFTLDKVDGGQIVDRIDANRKGTIRGATTAVAGKLDQALEFNGTTHVEVGETGVFERDQKYSISVWVYPTSTEPTTVLSKMDEGNSHRGYDLILEGAKVASHVVHHWPDNGFKVVSRQPLSMNEWHHLLWTYDGSSRASGVKIYVDGQLAQLDVTNDKTVTGTLKTDKPFHIGRRNASAPFKGRLDDIQLFATCLNAGDASRLASGLSPQLLGDLLKLPVEQRTDAQTASLREFYLSQVDLVSREINTELAAIPRQLADLEQAIPVTMVMQEMTPRRKTFLLKRGQYDQRADEVFPAVPSSLSLWPADLPFDRLGLARWLTSSAHPLTARVAVNRYWEMLFGSGIVETSEDFGIQGSYPSHPELLDWLATELIASGWNQRAILKQIVLSATYRQSSNLTAELLEKDPRNRLLSRGARYRLPAETVRDQSLAWSHLLSRRTGGPSVKPYQPEGLWEDVSVERREKYAPDLGEGLYRRSMYTFWKRTCPPPGMATFDAPDRETCVVRRARTNTPLQALALMNDPTFVEASRKLAERVLNGADSEEGRLALAWKICLCRAPREVEQDAFLSVLRIARERFEKDPVGAGKLLTVGHSPHDSRLPQAELAAWTTLMSMLQNLDEAITRH